MPERGEQLPPEARGEPSRKPVERVPIAELPEAKREQIDILESETDLAYELRAELADFYQRNRKYLPVVMEDGKRHAMRVPEIREKLEESVSLESLLPWRKVEADIDADTTRTDQQKKLRKIWVRRQLNADFGRAILTWDRLKGRGVAKGLSSDRSGDLDEITRYYRMRWRELGTAKRELDALAAQADQLLELQDIAKSDTQFVAHPDDLVELEEDYKKTIEQADALTENEPEAFYIARARLLKDAKETFDRRGRIVETPYVRRKMARIMDMIQQGRPVFIHGELGAGKTEIAKHIAEQELSKPHLSRWEEKNPRPSDPTQLKIWEAQRAKEAEPLEIPGHRAIEVEQIMASRKVERKPSKPPEEQIKEVAAAWRRFEENFQLSATEQQWSDDFVKTELAQLRPKFESLYFEALRNPIETKAVLGPFLRAQKEGRPVLWDEINANPHHILIITNDYLTRKPGDIVTPPFPDIEPYEVQTGYSVLATGNYKPEDGKLYMHRQPIDAAFLSRWGVVSYDYLPMSRQLESGEMPPEEIRKLRLQNELHHMLVARLVNKELSATIPANAIDQLNRLAFISRNVQDIFSGAGTSESFYALGENNAKIDPSDVLKENVLSIRHLLPVIDRWKAEGFQRSLDDYLFLEYVERSNARPLEKRYIYMLLQEQGDFFLKSEGWPDARNLSELQKFNIEKKMYSVNPVTRTREPRKDPELLVQYHSAREIIEGLFGPAPTRRAVTTEFLHRKERKKKAVEEVDETTLELERRVANLRRLAASAQAEGFNLKAESQRAKPPSSP